MHPFPDLRDIPIPNDADLHHRHQRIENLFARLKDWNRVVTRHVRCLLLFHAACALAATVIS
jgi:hypothetical protein